MKSVAVVISVYKEEMSPYEKMSLFQCCKILGKYALILVSPEGLDTSAYEDVFKEGKTVYKKETFQNVYFHSVQEYNKLLLGMDFYKRFVDFSYILIYQLDAYVFRDELNFWCEQGYDYIGAPWFEGYGLGSKSAKMLDVAGNGGFSLRSVRMCMRVIENGGEILEKYLQENINEDVYFAVEAPKIDEKFRVASPKVAMRFSFENLPEELYKMNGGHLPFGCHAWERYNPDFWQSFISGNLRDYAIELSVARKDLEQVKSVLFEARSNLKHIKSILFKTRSELRLAQTEFLVAQNEIGKMRSSREWGAILFIQRVVKMIFPKGSTRRKIVVMLGRFVKRILRFCVVAKKSIKEISLSWRIVYFKYLRPKKKRNINRNSKKLVYVGHSYHSKTKSSEFLIQYLKEFYAVEVLFDESWNGGKYPDLSFIDESYLGVVFFQNLPSEDVLKNIKNENIIFFPMYDGVEHTLNFWHKRIDFKIANFSKTLHKLLAGWGFDSMFAQYFPEPQEFIPGKKDEVFFWQRLTKMNIDVISKLFGDARVKMHVHKAIDPNQEFQAPSKEQEERYGITYSDWFPTREEMWGVIKQKGVYIAPREYEGIGMSFLEAMAMGKAVVAVDNPTMNEYIEHGKTGYLFDLKNPQAIDFSNIEEVQRNTYTFMKEGYEKWEREKHKIIEFIEK